MATGGCVTGTTTPQRKNISGLSEAISRCRKTVTTLVSTGDREKNRRAGQGGAPGAYRIAPAERHRPTFWWGLRPRGRRPFHVKAQAPDAQGRRAAGSSAFFACALRVHLIQLGQGNYALFTRRIHTMKKSYVQENTLVVNVTIDLGEIGQLIDTLEPTLEGESKNRRAEELVRKLKDLRREVVEEARREFESLASRY
jgi:hypothetical protein